ncbi:tRNA (adenosine(37)-N6)-threonylcarbamoyltransferase complex ATPase subunit type 1 TsaE [Nitrosomonas mobilis]|uniref:tRNA threonylcarbamoyladenosine biosynthesis protein TsaE n=1 Tax=Nitrosomonas mobilis TaxID=51642 RepID=A0A1G5SHJ1_9PROT|nr:tRNA (adenosine(37)-N6)-threonylcarbamoyltransferase complex ATPase subunit type 1 TsaE [Nitrosomonas mobilis]SCZ85849.1 ATPase with strong ADP affinity [Nitrosomonas mobilis]HNO76015.1 tRNA (adenosine(37)-N6)-threonylcarbamoyltransferase complex ATPase subunit type 1 TsaE [Nitrosomonas mobilis]
MHNKHHTETHIIPPSRITLADDDATLLLGAQLAPLLHGGLAVFLHGELGAGKTTLVRGMLRHLGHSGKVRSPTYNLVEIYKISRLYFYHFDFYRFNDPSEWEDAGFREYFNPDSVCLIEWPEKAAGLLDSPDLDITIDYASRGRIATIRANTEAGILCLQHQQNPRVL